MTYALGKTSLAKLVGVDPRLVRVIKRAILTTEADFGVHEGVRSKERQRVYVAEGVSQTMESRHLLQASGFGEAADLVPYVDGSLRWEWPPIYKIAAAMREASIAEAVPIRWGGCWRTLAEIGHGPDGMEAAVRFYTVARLRAGKKAFTDGPHYELAR